MNPQSKVWANQSILLTDIYDRVPTNEFAIESISCPLTPKSQIFISPLELTSILEGFTSVTIITLALVETRE